MYQAQQIGALLRGIPAFKDIDDAALMRLSASPRLEEQRFQPKQIIVREDEPADCMFIILEGTVEISIRSFAGREITVATLRAGDCFGEQAILPGGPERRNATAKAIQETLLLRILKSEVAAALAGQDEGVLPAAAESRSQQARHNLLRGTQLFQRLSEPEFRQLLEWVEEVDYQPGEFVVREGEPGEAMYIIADGAVEVFVVDDDGRVDRLARLARGDYFGEQSLLPHSKGIHQVNVRTDGAARLLRIPKARFLGALQRDQALHYALSVLGRVQQRRIQSFREGSRHPQ